MGVRLMMLMAMGLGAMYMMHLLAQDYNKIRKPVAAAARALASSSLMWRGKRDVREKVFVKELNYQEQLQLAERNATLSIDWNIILSRDPFECLQSLICQIASGAEGQSSEAVLLMEFIESTISMAPAKIGRAFSRGMTFRGCTDRCYDEYPFCWYSARTMLRMLKWFSDRGYAA